MKIYFIKVITIAIYLSELGIIHNRVSATTSISKKSSNSLAKIALVDTSQQDSSRQSKKQFNLERTIARSNNDESEDAKKKRSLSGVANPDRINQNIDERYGEIVEADEEKINLFEANKLIRELDNEPSDSTELEKQVLKPDTLEEERSFLFDPLAIGTISVASLASLILLFFVTKKLFAKEKVPENIVILYEKNFKKADNLAKKAERIDDDKFSNAEFLTYFKLKIKVNSKDNEYSKLCRAIKYLEVAIAAQSSYIKIEQTELRYRSRKQQEFYNFVIENINDKVDKDLFSQQIQKKLAEVLPLVNTEEGRTALKYYLQEVNKIAKHDLGLKLLSLFKKYQLTDFTILRKVADLVEQINNQEMLSEKNLTVLILENYEVLKKLAPIIEIPEEEVKPEIFVKLLQYMGLGRRHEKSFQQFASLIKLLEQWEIPAESLKVVRQQYSNGEYQLPKSFTKKIPGLNIYHKYENYLNKQNK